MVESERDQRAITGVEAHVRDFFTGHMMTVSGYDLGPGRREAKRFLACGSSPSAQDRAPTAGPGPFPSDHLRQGRPRRPGAVLERDRVDHLPMIPPPPTTLRSPVRQQRLDPCPLGVSQRHTSTNDPMIRRKRPSRCRGNGARRGHTSSRCRGCHRFKTSTEFGALHAT